MLYNDFLKRPSADNMQLISIVASRTDNPSGNKSFTFDPKDFYCYSNDWYALSKSDMDKVFKVISKRNGGKKVSNSGGQSKAGGGRNIGQGNWKSKITMLEKKYMESEEAIVDIQYCV